MKKEDVTRIYATLDKHTEILMSIQKDISKDISLIKLAQQKLKYVTMGLTIMFLIKLTIDYPHVAVLIKKII